MVGSSVGLLLILLARANWQGVYTDPFTLIAGLTVGGMLVAHLITRSTQKLAEEHRERMETQNSDLAAQTSALNAANEQMQEQIQQQTKLLDFGGAAGNTGGAGSPRRAAGAGSGACRHPPRAAAG